MLWSAVTVVTAGLVHVLRGDLLAARHDVLVAAQPDFAVLLGAAATVVVALCAVWVWAVTTAATIEALRGVRVGDVPGARGLVRRLVLTACGVAFAATVSPAQADDLRGVAGQPPQPLTAATATTPTPMGDDVVVEPGDSLWRLSADQLRSEGRPAADADVDRAWRALWAANAAVVGAQPDLIEPGQVLELPEALR